MPVKTVSVNLIGKIGFGKVPQESEWYIGAAVIIMFVIAYFVVSAYRKSNKSITKMMNKGSPTKTTPAAASPKQESLPQKTPGKTKQSAKTTPEVTDTARKSERLRAKTPKKWD